MDVGDDDLAALAGQPERLAEDLAVADAHRHDDLVEATVPRAGGQIAHRIVDRCVGVRGAELHRLLALELDRIDGSDDAGTGQLGTLNRVGADAAGADDGDHVAGLRPGPSTPPSPSR